MEGKPLGYFTSSLAATRAPPLAIHDAINAATSRQHNTLNRLIINRIPLALPPAATDPASYGQGIAAFAQTYFAFEQIWQELSDATGLQTSNYESHETQLRQWLATLRPPGLARTERLRNDLRNVSRCTGADFDIQNRTQERVLRRIRLQLHRKPHTLVAYAWVMYMALFSGGRIVRQSLSRAGPDFFNDGMGSTQKQRGPLGATGILFPLLRRWEGRYCYQGRIQSKSCRGRIPPERSREARHCSGCGGPF